ncbi:MAG: SDR family oxidoreductase [Burkholderiaceae bacterium]
MNTQAALVTGGASGIGLGIAHELEKIGITPIVFDRNAPPQGTPGEFVQVDLSDANLTAEALRELVQRTKVTGLVNNVAAVGAGRIEDVTYADIQQVWELNIRCAIQCVQALLPAMKESHSGRIVNIASRASLGKAYRTVYGASKAGLHSMTRTWTLELARYGVTVNTVSPGPIETPLFRATNTLDNPRTAYLINSIPVGKMGQPEDIANAVGFFFRPESWFITGQNLYVDGGMSIALAGADGHPPGFVEARTFGDKND